MQDTGHMVCEYFSSHDFQAELEIKEDEEPEEKRGEGRGHGYS